MKQIVNTADGDTSVLEVVDRPDPEPEADEVVVDVKAAGINFADILARRGLYPDAPPKPCVVGYEASGIVSAAGASVDSDMLDQPVIAFTRFGGQSSKIVVKHQQIFKKPDRLSFEQAATLPVNYLTAYALIVVMGSLQSYESILIHNAGGGVGLAAIDIAKQIGATIYGTASSRKHEFIKDRGVDVAIDYRTQDWYEQLMEYTQGKGVDLITDPIGGKHWKKSYKALRSTGRLGMFGISSASEYTGVMAKLQMLRMLVQMPIFHPMSLLDNKGVFGLNLGHLWHEPGKANHWMQAILDGVSNGWITPHVDKVFSFDEVGQAHTYIEERNNIGKVILVPETS